MHTMHTDDNPTGPQDDLFRTSIFLSRAAHRKFKVVAAMHGNTPSEEIRQMIEEATKDVELPQEAAA